MSAGSVAARRPIEVPRGRSLRPALIVGAAAVVGSVEMLLGYLLFRASVVGPVPSHFQLSGATDATLPLGEDLVAGVATLGGIAVVLLGVLVLSARTPIAGHYASPSLGYLLGGWGALLLAGALPAAWLLPVAALAGEVPPTLGGAAAAALVGGVLPAGTLVVLVALSARGRLRRETSRADPRGSGAHRTRIHRLTCTACGGSFERSSIPLLTPHLPASKGSGALGLLLTRCPRCGERGWNMYRGRGEPASTLSVEP